jgi:magnesium transporter
MTPDYLTLRPEWTVGEALAHIRTAGGEAETLHTLYVIDRAGRLIDYIKLHDLVLAPIEGTCEQLRQGAVVSLHAQADREQAVRMMQRYDLPVLPVVDADRKLVGIVTFDDVADVASEEVTEDMHKLGGMEALGKSYLSATLGELIHKRGVWLMVLFIGGLLTVTAMGLFHEQLEQKAILALFVPLIIASGGNSGTQAATLVVRALALGELKVDDWGRIMRRELVGGLVLGSLLGVIGMAIATAVAFYLPSARIDTLPAALHVGFAIGTAVVGVVVTGIFTGAMLPVLLEWVGLDPATCSTPFVATIADVAGLVIYFIVAILVLGI